MAKLRQGTILYIPQGEHHIAATVNGKPAHRRVVATESCVASLQRDLERMQGAALHHDAPYPCGLFDHAPGPRSFLPRAFRWEEGRGIVLDVDYTEAGLAAIEGKNYAYFSPRCAISQETDEPCGLLPYGTEIGSFVNDPAFRTTDELCASFSLEAACNQYGHGPGCTHRNETPGNADPETAKLPRPGGEDKLDAQSSHNFPIENPDNMPQNTDMSKITEALGLPADADEAALLAAIEKLKTDAQPEALEAAQDEARKLREECQKKDDEIKAARADLAATAKANEDRFIADAIAAGRIAPKDEKRLETWRKLYRADAVEAANAITAIPARGTDSLIAANNGTQDTRTLAELLRDTHGIQ